MLTWIFRNRFSGYTFPVDFEDIDQAEQYMSRHTQLELMKEV